MKTVGVYIWPSMTMLDMVGAQQILGFVPEVDVVTVAKSKDPVTTDTKLRILPDHDFESCPPVDVLVVGDGIDPSAEMRDDAVMAWMRSSGESAEYVTSVCTGALILAEAGLLDGYKATTHWAYTGMLDAYPEVELGEGRVVTDRNRITGGGVTASIDFGFALATELAGPEHTAALQLMSQYDPEPATAFGNPETAPPEMVAVVREQFAAMSPGLAELFASKSAEAAL